MSSTTSAGPMANSVFVVAPHHGYPVAPGGMPQVPLYPRSQPQVHLIPGNPPGLERAVCVQPAQRALKEGKTLGAIQILIGLLHIGLGSVMGTLLHVYYYVPVSFYGGFPFWGGIWFIISGSLSVSAENQPRSTCLLNGSLGLNIISAICSVIGIILFITDMSVTNLSVYPDYYPYREVAPGMAISGVLFIFCLLEFCIACTSAHFGCQLVCYSPNSVDVVYPNVYVANSMVIPEPANLPPPMYSSEVQGSR
ncbi:membrane spanning 4-domains A8 [Rhinolophus ferrumequinum]|uniref:Membrane spanning 4-domains A8 n=1 Tax=Rhinolophus ferrumequinum TaxID=59479 RepID=A0A671DQ84_RHIFE|nr:membrane-spanning 4-domains subfamily A member 8 isoform X1 [Rhinolophus ferrumequinum]XP_032975873.1 membrane-spanning 4-domains subfamily A member 8 isoform X1 [Rhinolophus ferrumequinum]XP_032975874.1 membrane-spanning 4-domains subfamily A member 8 isoform X1 [Rhinolophus ferrumequinum]KAF6333630.1 membrane spanning 4-domains A8 [Rhinolophus ferrumequinum]